MKDKSRLKEIAIPKDKTINWNTTSKHSSDDQWEIVTDPNQIEKYNIHRNATHLNQAHGTPFTVNPLHSLLNNNRFPPLG